MNQWHVGNILNLASLLAYPLCWHDALTLPPSLPLRPSLPPSEAISSFPLPGPSLPPSLPHSLPVDLVATVTAVVVAVARHWVWQWQQRGSRLARCVVCVLEACCVWQSVKCGACVCRLCACVNFGWGGGQGRQPGEALFSCAARSHGVRRAIKAAALPQHCGGCELATVTSARRPRIPGQGHGGHSRTMWMVLVTVHTVHAQNRSRTESPVLRNASPAKSPRIPADFSKPTFKTPVPTWDREIRTRVWKPPVHGPKNLLVCSRCTKKRLETRENMLHGAMKSGQTLEGPQEFQ